MTYKMRYIQQRTKYDVTVSFVARKLSLRCLILSY